MLCLHKAYTSSLIHAWNIWYEITKFWSYKSCIDISLHDLTGITISIPLMPCDPTAQKLSQDCQNLNRHPRIYWCRSITLSCWKKRLNFDNMYSAVAYISIPLSSWLQNLKHVQWSSHWSPRSSLASPNTDSIQDMFCDQLDTIKQ